MATIINADQRQQIRKNPDMYGPIKNPNHMVQEAMDNAIDQVIAGHATHIIVCIHNDGSASVMDNGQGIPFTLTQTATGESMPTARMAWTVPNSSSHYNQAATTSLGKNGIGMKYTSATSEWMIGEAWRKGKYYKDEYETLPVPQTDDDMRLNPIVYKTPLSELKGEPYETTPFNFASGTRVRFKPNGDIFESVIFDTKALRQRMHEQAFLNPGTRFIYINEKDNEAVDYYEPDGLKSYVRLLAKDHKLLTDVYEFKGRADLDTDNYVEADIALGYVEDQAQTTLSFVNSIKTPDDGTHVTGFYSGWSKLANSYADKFNLSKTTIATNDLKPGIVVVISAKHTQPQYSGQTKDRLANDDANSAVSKIVRTDGRLALDRNPKDIETIIKRALENAKLRKKLTDITSKLLSDPAQKRAVAKKIHEAAMTGLYDKKGNRIRTECIIVEGDSAGGGIARKRINDAKRGIYQAVAPLRGKSISAFKNDIESVKNNAEVLMLFTALGCGLGNNVDLSKLNYWQILITTDADVDGGDIYLQLLAIFVKLCPELLTEGHVRRIVTPLYINFMSKKKGDHVFTYSDAEQSAFLAKNKPVRVERNKGLGEMDDDIIYETICDPDTRRVINCTFDDFDRYFKQIELFMGEDVEPRRAFIEENAHLFDDMAI